MAMIRLAGKITPQGKLEIELPSDIEAGDVIVTIDPDFDSQAWTDEEIAELFRPVLPKTGAEIVARLLQESTGWEETEDGATWVESQRKMRQADTQW